MMHPLKKWMKEQHVTAEQFAERIASTASYVSQIVTGTRRPSVDLARLIESSTNGDVKAADALLWERKSDEDAVGGEPAKAS